MDNITQLAVSTAGAQFRRKLLLLIEQHGEEHDMPLTEVLGIVEIVKAELITAAVEDTD